MAKKTSIDERSTVDVALIIEIDGSAVQNRITAFKLPYRVLVPGVTDDEPGRIEFETIDLKEAIINAVKNL